MAVEAILSTALEQIINLTAPPVIRYLRPIWGGVDGDLGKLRWNLLQIQPLIEDAEERQLMDQAVKAWLMLLRDVAYDADDILDQANTHVLLIQRKAEFYGPLRSKVRDFFSLHHNPLLFQLQLGHKLRSINRRIDGIIEEMHKFNFKVADNNRPSMNRRQTYSFVPESEVIGRDEEKEQIVQMLIRDHFEEKVTVVSIVGMGGLGKTTLAQLVCGDKNVKNHFDKLCIWWVCVSDDFDVAKLARNIIITASGESYDDNKPMEVLQQDLRQLLELKRYLLVLDDVWNDAPLKWDALRNLLVAGAEGSRILVTTRNENCSRIMGAKKSYLLQCLSEERSWALFEGTFTTNVSRQPDFPEIGKKIVNKCKGLPLAIKVMGSVMCSKREESQWQAVLDNNIWDTQHAKDEIRPELWLSYVDLPSQLKKCFAFCAIFPKDSFIEEGMLVQSWMAHGFIPSQTGKDIVVEGQDILDELIGRSLLQFDTGGDRGPTHYFTSLDCFTSDEFDYVPGYRLCKMHDLIHDLAQFVTGDECSTLPERNEFMKISKRTRHFILNPDVEYDMGDRAPTLRTALPVGTNFIGLSKLKLLRVLVLHEDANVDKLLSTSIEYLHHLRYLNLSFAGIRDLPESICMLINLQTLNLNHCNHLTKLPMSIAYMNSLRHLHLKYCLALKILPPGLSQLRCWKTLTEYTVAENPENKIGELKHWNLDGRLRLYDLYKLKNVDEAQEANMSSKQNIKSLSLSWGLGALVENVEQVLEALKPHATLKELSLHYYPGTQFSMWIRDRQQLQNLVKIELEGCKGCEQLPPLEQLPYLKELTIDGMDGIKYIINNTTGDALPLFPALRYLYLYNMDNLEGWCVEEDRETAPPLFPCLKSLIISQCPKLTTMPLQLPTLKNLTIKESYRGTQIELMSKEKGFFKHLKSLESLRLTRCDELALLLEDEEETRYFTSSLRSLRINACSQFSLSAALQNLTSLEDLSINDLEELVSWPDEMFRGLESIRSLDIMSCDALIELPKCPTSLKSLSVFNCPSIKSLCSDMGHLTSLLKLELSKCPMLESLPEGMQGLTSLRRLSIEGCQALKSFPEGLQQQLSNLKWLKISGCPKLERRCSPGGDYFRLVSSISEKSIKSGPRRTLLAPCL